MKKCFLHKIVPMLVAISMVIGSLSHLTIQVSAANSPTVDIYGQYIAEEWDNKIESDADLVSDATTESALLANVSTSFDTELYDQYGGVKSMGNQGATGYFYVKNIDGVLWLVTPEGYPYFMKGVDAIGYNESGYSTPIRDAAGNVRSEFQALPDETLYSDAYETSGKVNFLVANLMKKYGADWKIDWENITLKRLMSWGFNSTGVWGWGTKIGLPYIQDLNLIGATRINGQVDPFADSFESVVEYSVSTLSAEYVTDPFLIGYAIENENGWNSLTVDTVLKQGPNCAAKNVLIDFLIDKYGFANVVEMFEMDAETTREDILDETLSINSMSAIDVSTFVRAASERYHAVIAAAVKSFDPNHMYWGDNLMVTQQGRDWIDGAKDYVDGFLLHEYDYATNYINDQLEVLAEYGKPVMVTEFSFVVAGRGMPMYNAANTVSTQEDRGMAYRFTTESLASNPLIVGCSWFIYYDQPVTARTLGGESYNFGLVNQQDQVYTDAVSHITDSNLRLESVHNGAVSAIKESELVSQGFNVPQPSADFLTLVDGSKDACLNIDLSASSYYGDTSTSGDGKYFRWKLDERLLPSVGWHNCGVWYAGDGKVYSDIRLQAYLWSLSTETPESMFKLQESSNGKDFTDVTLTFTDGATNVYNEYWLTPTDGLNSDTRYLRFCLNVTDPTISFQNEIGAGTIFTVDDDISVLTSATIFNIENLINRHSSLVVDSSNPQYFGDSTYRYKLQENTLSTTGYYDGGTWFAGDNNVFKDFDIIASVWATESPLSRVVDRYKIYESADNSTFTEVELVANFHHQQDGSSYALYSLTPANGLKQDTSYLKFSIQVYNTAASFKHEITDATSFVISKAHSHELTAVAASPATCKDAGHTAYYTCYCGKWFSDSLGTTIIEDHNSIIIPALGHSLLDVTATESTCTTHGNIAYAKCQMCNTLFNNGTDRIEITEISTQLDLASHNYINVEFNDLSHWYICSVCDNASESAAHSYVWVLDSAATTVSTGIKHEECSVCGIKRNENTSIAVQTCAHALVHYSANACACETDGNLEYWYCTICDNYHYDSNGQLVAAYEDLIISKTGHNLVHFDAVEATYRSDGNIEYWKCDNCDQCFADENASSQLSNTDIIIPQHEYLYDDIFKNLVDNSAHEALVVDSSSPNYFNNSTYRYKLDETKLPSPGMNQAGTWYAGSGNTFSDIIMVGALWVNSSGVPLDWFALYESTDGVNFTEVELSAKITYRGTNYNLIDFTPTNGLGQGIKYLRFALLVSDPGKSWQNQITDDTLFYISHTHSLTKYSGFSATCTSEGQLDYWYCDTCSNYYIDAEGESAVDLSDTVIPVEPHNYDNWTSNETSHWQICSDCNTSSDQTTHAFEWVVDQAATVDATGLKHEECTICGYKRNENTIIDQIACTHNLTHITANSATCTESGNIEYWECSICGKCYTDSACMLEVPSEGVVIPALGHAVEKISFVDSTYFAKGNIEHWRCSRCTKLFSDSSCTTELTDTEILISEKKFTTSNEIFTNLVPGSESTYLSVDTGNATLFNNSAYRYKLNDSATTGMHNAGTWYAGTDNVFTSINMVGALWSGCTNDPETMFELYESSDNSTFTKVTLTFTENENSGDRYTLYNITPTSGLSTNTRYLRFMLNVPNDSSYRWQNQITDETVFTFGHVHDPIYKESCAASCTADGNIAYWECTQCGRYFSTSACTEELSAEDIIIPKTSVVLNAQIFNQLIAQDDTLVVDSSNADTYFNGSAYRYKLNDSASGWYDSAGTWYAGDNYRFQDVSLVVSIWNNRGTPTERFKLFESSDGETFTEVTLTSVDTVVCGTYTLHTLVPNEGLREDTRYLRFGIYAESGYVWGNQVTNASTFDLVKIEPHSYSEWETVTEATETSEGLKQKVCSACGHTVTETIPVISEDDPN